MTTNFLDYKMCTFKIVLSWRFPRKAAFWTIFLSAPFPPLKIANFVFVVVSPSLKTLQEKTNFFKELRAKFV